MNISDVSFSKKVNDVEVVVAEGGILHDILKVDHRHPGPPPGNFHRSGAIKPSFRLGVKHDDISKIFGNIPTA